MRQSQRGDRQNGESLVIDDEGILVGAMRRAAILDNPHAARRDLILHPVIEQYDAVGDVLFETVARQGAFAAFASNQRRDAFFF